jgi:hypothetical protein
VNFSRLRTGEIVAAIGGIALLVFMFLPWFGLPGEEGFDLPQPEEVQGLPEGVEPAPSVEIDESRSAWDALLDFDGFLIFLAAASGIALGGFAAAGQRLNLGAVPRGAGTFVLGSLAVLLILWRVLANPGDLKFGIFLGLLAAAAIAVGAFLALTESGVRVFATTGAPGARAGPPSDTTAGPEEPTQAERPATGRAASRPTIERDSEGSSSPGG